METTEIITCVSLKDLITRAEDVNRERKDVWLRVEAAIVGARLAMNSAEQEEIESAYIGLENALKARDEALIELAAANIRAVCE